MKARKIIPSCSVIISFYNKIDDLRLVFASLERQTFKDFEVFIADDGSGENVIRELKELQKSVSFPSRHVWHEHQGFRKDKILNMAVTKAQSKYLIFIDGDCILHKNFIQEHNNYREKQVCLTGKRVLLSPNISKLLTPEKIHNGYLESHYWKLIFDSIVGKSTLVEKGWYCKNPVLRKILNTKNHGILGCNFSLFKTDLMAINGFDERYQFPYVGEDTDIDFRLRLNGVTIRYLYNIAVQYHLFHLKQPRSDKNLEIFKNVQNSNLAYTPFGIKKRCDFEEIEIIGHGNQT